ncbi:uncharacterized protein BT62DRAFT_938415 [Guyanagaster necrorhizus]|uniref:Uncharacterized protein n=1 Tax=Guyanagaster necrorhizus TaxID=856835 RepID=A0A9P7VGE4_9AGAR|nr:uncharacterized protein BT62DRAFT_938415 [Guyanagaster necrorhizus MCA 3950]KAG7440078.1 hypothetical protein BT62DRAFT_938415 [Guyanagaster necrorhizus MCA 3950]
MTDIHDQATLAAAIANFKPTPREVISGIAPHVFEDRRYLQRRRSSRRNGSPGRRQRGRQGAKRSPLRVSAVINLDDPDETCAQETVGQVSSNNAADAARNINQSRRRTFLSMQVSLVILKTLTSKLKTRHH